MKKIIALLLCTVILAGIFTGCGKKTNSQINSKTGKIKIVTTIFPEYDWVREIAGDQIDNIDLTMLLGTGVDLHSFQPSADDIIKISSCDMFIYVGGESDEWVNDVLKEATNPNMVVIDLLDVLGEKVREEELVEGMQAESKEENGVISNECEEVEYDEHVWLSLKNASALCNAISEKLCQIDPENKTKYSDNTKTYINKLNSLDDEYKNAVDSSSVKTILFGDRFPFRYLVDDYGLSYYAAFAGCSAESEASFETITFLAGKVDELRLKSILKIESSDGSIANTIKDNTKTKDQTIQTMDSMQSVTKEDIKNSSVTYLSIMENNLSILKDALK